MAHGIDHLVLAVRDLDAAGAHYQALGFRVGARNRHPWGTENRIVQLPGTFLELITMGGQGITDVAWADRSRFASFSQGYLDRHGDGFAMLVLESDDAWADQAAFDDAGIGGFEPFFFERFGRKSDGNPVRVAFTLAFAADKAMPDVGCFVSQQHERQNFWDPDFQAHPNGARRLGGVVLLAARPAATVPFFEAFTGARAACAGARNMAIVTPRGSVEAMTPECYRDVLGLEGSLSLADGPRLAAFKVWAPLEAMAERLDGAAIAYVRHRKHLAVPAADNFGTALVFEEPKTA